MLDSLPFTFDLSQKSLEARRHGSAASWHFARCLLCKLLLDADGALVRWWSDESNLDRRACNHRADRESSARRRMGGTRAGCRACLLGSRHAAGLVPLPL